MNSRAQRKVVIGLVGALIGLGFALVALSHHDGRQIVARWLALMVLGIWLAGYSYRDGKRPQPGPRRRWGEGSLMPSTRASRR